MRHKNPETRGVQKPLPTRLPISSRLRNPKKQRSLDTSATTGAYANPTVSRGASTKPANRAGRQPRAHAPVPAPRKSFQLACLSMPIRNWCFAA